MVNRFKLPQDDYEASRLTWLRVPYVVAATAALWVVCILLLPGARVFDLADCVLVSLAVSVVTSYMQGMVRATDLTYRGKLLVAGILCTWAATIYNRGLQIILRNIYHAPPPVDFDSWISVGLTTVALYVVTVGGLLHIAAPGAITGHVPDANWLRMGRAFGLGIFAFMMLIWFL